MNNLDHFKTVLVGYIHLERSKTHREGKEHCNKVVCAVENYIPTLQNRYPYTQRLEHTKYQPADDPLSKERSELVCRCKIQNGPGTTTQTRF